MDTQIILRTEHNETITEQYDLNGVRTIHTWLKNPGRKNATAQTLLFKQESGAYASIAVAEIKGNRVYQRDVWITKEHLGKLIEQMLEVHSQMKKVTE